MKLQALAAVAAATPLMVACGSAEKTTYSLNGAGATFLLLSTLLGSLTTIVKLSQSKLSSSW